MLANRRPKIDEALVQETFLPVWVQAARSAREYLLAARPRIRCRVPRARKPASVEADLRP